MFCEINNKTIGVHKYLVRYYCHVVTFGRTGRTGRTGRISFLENIGHVKSVSHNILDMQLLLEGLTVIIYIDTRCNCVALLFCLSFT